MNGREAGDSYLRALVAKRDAKRLIDLGFASSVAAALVVIRDDQRQLDVRTTINGVAVTAISEEAVALVALKEAADAIELYDRDPAHCPEGRTAAEAYAAAMKRVRARYQRGQCRRCKGPALPCARRHARGLSCA